MAKIGPVSRSKLIRQFHTLGFDGPFSGGKHLFMSRNETIVRIPNPHAGDISSDLLVRLLKQAGVSRKEWLES